MRLRTVPATVLSRGRLVAHFLAVELGLLLIALGAYRLTHLSLLPPAAATAAGRTDWLITGSGALLCLLALLPGRHPSLPSPFGRGGATYGSAGSTDDPGYVKLAIPSSAPPPRHGEGPRGRPEG